jgi:hypothetical protein
LYKIIRLVIEHVFVIIVLEVSDMNKISVECITVMNHKEITPMRVRYEDDEGAHVIKVEKILVRNKKPVMPSMSNPRSTEYTFRCETIQDGIKRPFTLVFNDQSCKWLMYYK